MLRRDFVLGSAAALAACAARTPAGPHAIRAVAFDLFTLFDPRGIEQRVAAALGSELAPRFAATWLTRAFEYAWLRALADRYAPFDRLVADALAHAGRVHGVEAPAALARAFVELAPWPDTRATLAELRARGLRLAPLANFAPAMIRDLLAHADLAGAFDDVLSTDLARTYKPAPRAYALAEQRLGLPRDAIAFAAFGRWDAFGAHAFGLRTFWVDRLGAPDEFPEPAIVAAPDFSAVRAALRG